MAKKTKKPNRSPPKKIKGEVPDTSRAQETKLSMVGKELKIDKQLDKKKEVKEKDVFDFSTKPKK
tara:strand:- start:130 stop:324 length:195 start_codon:yes stop_codon:yes gene_type:complete